MINYIPPKLHYLPGALSDCEAEMIRRWQACSGYIIPDWYYFSTDECIAVSNLVRYKYLHPAKHGGYTLAGRATR